MDTPEKEPAKREREPRETPWFSCAFCSAHGPKPFKICEECGREQPDDEDRDR